MLDKNSRYYGLVVFFARFFALYILWFFLYDMYLQPKGYLDKYLIISQSVISGKLLSFLQYENYVSFVAGKFGIITFSEGQSLKISHYCDGLVLFALYTGFIVSFPGGNVWDKVRFVLLGIGLIYLANLVRIVVLCIIFVEVPQYLDFNHKYVFTSIIYAMIFLLWKIWIDYSILQVKKASVD